MISGKPTRIFATGNDVRAAIERLSVADLARLNVLARRALIGTEYRDAQELVNEAVTRVMAAAGGARGRRWPLDVQFIPFMVMTMTGIASDSRESPKQKRTKSLETLAEHHGDAGRVLGAHGLAHSDPLDETLAEEDRSREEQAAAEDAALIDEHFKADEQVLYLILGGKEGNSASEIKEFSGMTQHQYEAAKRRFHRGLDKLFPGRRNN